MRLVLLIASLCSAIVLAQSPRAKERARAERELMLLTDDGTALGKRSPTEPRRISVRAVGEEQLTRNAVLQLNAALILPRDLAVVILQCGDAPLATFDVEMPTLVVCTDARRAQFFVFFHALMHVIAHELNLPGDEASIDELAAILATAAKCEDALRSSATAFAEVKQPARRIEFSKKHALDTDRLWAAFAQVGALRESWKSRLADKWRSAPEQ